MNIRKKNPADFSTAGRPGSSSAPDTNVKAGRHKNDNILHGLDAKGQTFNTPPNTVPMQNNARRTSTTEVVQGPGHPATTSLSPRSKARSMLGVGITQSHNNVEPAADYSNNRFQDPNAAIRNSPERHPATPRQLAVELPADPTPGLAGGDLRITEGNKESDSSIPPGELDVLNKDNTLTSDQIPLEAALSFQVPEEHLDREELHFGNMNNEHHSLTGYDRSGQHSTYSTPVRERLEHEVSQPTSSISPIDPRADQIRRLEKCNAELTKENRNLIIFKRRCGVHDERRKADEIKISTLHKELEQIAKESERVKNDAQTESIQLNQKITALEKEGTRYSQELRVTKLELRRAEQVVHKTKNRLRECEEELRVRYQDIDILTRQTKELQHENESINKRHEVDMSFLKDEHRRAIIHLEQESRSISEKAQKDLEDANNKHETEMLDLNKSHKTEVLLLNEKHETEVLGLNEKHRRETDDMTSKFEEEMKIQSHHMQSIVDEKNRTIAAQDIRMASYNKQIHGVIPDGELERKFRSLTLSIDNLVNELPRPESYVVDTALDRVGFLRRNSPRGSRVWPKFLRKVCWDSLIRGFFQLQPGFDSSDPKRDFPNNKKANSWRASLFGAILNEVMSTINDSSVIGFSKFFRNNVRIVRNDLVETLEKVCQKDLDARCSRQVLKLCNDVGLLSLQLGAQQSVIVLETCCHEEWTQSGALFKDDNDFNENSLKVDIMVQPALKRIGDGGQDFTTQKVLVAGRIVALKAGMEINSN
ncbi:hypothetical protein RRF57_009336 [Xylaria bambusicola]|uniref:Uncharacterized protein n=1 Tax=Xylaria bambusicola TaxID=326684 RepID=A0AAN7Z8W8_9PEZI